MANPVNINVGAIQRPGVFVAQSVTGGLPQPLASHAIGYIFGSTPTDPYDDSPIDNYASLLPYTPTQIGSLDDWVQKAGGVPTASSNPQSIISYDSVKAFFENVGVNGILYYTRVTPTPESKVIVTKGAGWNLFALKIGGRYFGDTKIGTESGTGIDIRVITTTALDANDNAFDIVGYLKNDDPDFKTFYRIEQTPEESRNATFRIYSKDTREVPTIESFKAYQISDTAYASPTDASTISRYVPIKDINLRCVSRDLATSEAITSIDGGAIGNFIEEASVSGLTAETGSFVSADNEITMRDIDNLSIGTDALAVNDMVVFEGYQATTGGYDVSGDVGGTSAVAAAGDLVYSKIYYVQSVDAANDQFTVSATEGGAAVALTADRDLVVRVRRIAYNPSTAADVHQAIEDFLIDQEIYASASAIPSGKVVAVTTDERIGKDNHIKWSDAWAAYYRWDGSDFTSGFDGTGLTVAPSGQIVDIGGSVTRSGYVPDSVQVFYVNVAGENRVIIANGSTPAELTADVVKSLKEILEEKALDAYYEVEAVDTDYSSLSSGTYVPNNGIGLGTTISAAGRPALRPTNDGKALTGTVKIVANDATISSVPVANEAGTLTIDAAGNVTGLGTNFASTLRPGFRILVGSETYEIALVGSDTSAVVNMVPGASTASGATFKLIPTRFTEDLYVGAQIVINGYRLEVASIAHDGELEVTTATTPTWSASSTSIYLDSSIKNGFNRHDYVLRVKITSKNGIPSPIVPGLDRYNQKDTNVIRVNSVEEAADFTNYKLNAKSRAQDFVYAIEQGMGTSDYRPGFLIAPEAFGSFKQETGVLTKKEAREERVKVTQALLRAAEGKLGEVEGITGTQHIALIDCGADELSLSEVQDELAYIKSVAGAPFGHAAFYAPYIKNAADRFVPPSGFVAGIACSRYVNEGFQQAPAGARYPLRGANGLRFDITAQQQEVTYPLGLNPIRSLPNRGIVAWGARTTSSNALFKYVNTRAILNVLLDVMARSFDDILFEQIDSAGTLYSRAKSIASQIMGQLYRQGALFGARPEQAYLVVCSDANNALSDLENGTLRLDAYVATSPTLERLVVTVVRTPAGQVAQVQDSFSRNVDRFDYLLNATTIN